ncbi:MAG: hypothetical protein K8T89_01095 [Planctomycetes bacterium]|nr:hypothetical protein [Planctomycetota bacterium]
MRSLVLLGMLAFLSVACNRNEGTPVSAPSPADRGDKVDTQASTSILKWCEVGTTWTYEVKSFRTELGKTTEIVSKITKKAVRKETINNIPCVVIEGTSSDSPGTFTEYIGQGPDGLYISPRAGSKELILLWKTISKPGDTWPVKYPALFEGGDLIAGTAKHLEVATVTTPRAIAAVSPFEITVQKEIVPGIVKKETAIYYLSFGTGFEMIKRESDGKPTEIQSLEKYSKAE